MYSRNLLLIFAFALLMTVCDTASAQVSKSSRGAGDASQGGRGDSDDDKNPFASFGDKMSEMREKNRIHEMEKDHDEMVQRGDNAAILSEQINKSFTTNKKLGSQDVSKLNDIEKTLKKIRRTLGGGDNKDDDKDGSVNENHPQSMEDATKKLAKISEDLHEDLKASSPYTISANSIEEINDLLYIVDYLRIKSR